MIDHHRPSSHQPRHRHDSPHCRRQQERRLGIEPVEERVLLSAAPILGPQPANLQTLNVAALSATPASQTTAQAWANTNGFLAVEHVGNWTSVQPRLEVPRPVAPLPEPSRALPLRISEADLQPTSRRAESMIDTTPRQEEQHLLAMAQTAYREQLLVAQTAGVDQRVGMPPAAESPQLHDVRLDTPTPTDVQPLNGQRGRAQAFDLAMRPAPVATLAAVAEMPVIEAIAPEEVLSRIEAIALAPELPPEARDTASDVGELTSHDAVFAEMSDSPTVADPIRLDVGQSRRAMVMLVVALLATEVAPRSDRLDEDGTYLHPLPRVSRAPKAGR